MKSFKLLFTVLIALLSFFNYSYSQPKLIIHAYGGLSLPLPDLKGVVPPAPVANTLLTDYGMRIGVNFGVDGKYAFDKNGNIRAVVGLGYNLFMNPAEYASITGSYKYKPMIGILTASLGAEYAFLPKGKTNPFVGVDFTANFFNGSFEYDPQFTGIPNVTLKPATRFGIQFNAGVDIQLGKSIGIVVGGKYNLANLIGKDSDTSKFSAASIPTERPLNDKEYTYGGLTYSSKNISYLQYYVGISFYLMQPKKVKK